MLVSSGTQLQSRSKTKQQQQHLQNLFSCYCNLAPEWNPFRNCPWLATSGLFHPELNFPVVFSTKVLSIFTETAVLGLTGSSCFCFVVIFPPIAGCSLSIFSLGFSNSVHSKSFLFFELVCMCGTCLLASWMI